MTYSTAYGIFEAIYVAGMITTGWLALQGKWMTPSISYQRGFVFRNSRPLIWVAVAYCLWLVLSGALLTPLWWDDVRGSKEDSFVKVLSALGFFIVFDIIPLVLSTVIICSLPFTLELSLNKSNQTYVIRHGTLLKKKIVSGTWEEIRGVSVKPVRGKGGVIISYSVYIVWKSGKLAGPSLGLCKNLVDADQLATRLSRDLGLPVISPNGAIKIRTDPLLLS